MFFPRNSLVKGREREREKFIQRFLEGSGNETVNRNFESTVERIPRNVNAAAGKFNELKRS